MLRHSQFKKPEPMWQYDFCAQTFETQKRYLRHVKTHQTPDNEEHDMTDMVEAGINCGIFLSVIGLLMFLVFHK